MYRASKIREKILYKWGKSKWIKSTFFREIDLFLYVKYHEILVKCRNKSISQKTKSLQFVNSANKGPMHAEWKRGQEQKILYGRIGRIFVIGKLFHFSSTFVNVYKKIWKCMAIYVWLLKHFLTLRDTIVNKYSLSY